MTKSTEYKLGFRDGYEEKFDCLPFGGREYQKGFQDGQDELRAQQDANSGPDPYAEVRRLEDEYYTN